MNAIDQFVTLFESKNQFINSFVDSALFFPSEIVEKRNQRLLKIFEKGEKLPIRYSRSLKKLWGIKNKKEAKAYSKNNDAYLKGYPELKVIVDNDGNTEVRSVINKYFGHKVSIGKNSTIKNYTISHVWGKATHPLFFSSLWNIVLIPTHFNYLMDKSADSHDVVKEVKSAIKQKCISLYSPYENFLHHFDVGKEIRKDFRKNPSLETEYQPNFIPHVDTLDKEITVPKEEKEELDRLLKSIGKSFFIEHFDVLAEEKDPENNIPLGEYTISSYRTRISKMNKIFSEGLEEKALKLTLESRLDNDILDRAQELFELYN